MILTVEVADTGRQWLAPGTHWEVRQERIERIAGFEVLDERLHRDTRPDKDGGVAYDPGIAMDGYRLGLHERPQVT